jgi:23S rRNA (guanine745-N1)-methyltransferase
VRRPLPVRSQAASLVLDVFSPRNGPEFRRVVRPRGALVVVTPGPDHLRELAGELHLLSVDELKEDRLQRSLGGHFRLEWREEHGIELLLGHADLENVARMGPSAWHLAEGELRARVARFEEPARVTASFVVSLYRPLAGADAPPAP